MILTLTNDDRMLDHVHPTFGMLLCFLLSLSIQLVSNTMHLIAANLTGQFEDLFNRMTYTALTIYFHFVIQSKFDITSYKYFLKCLFISNPRNSLSLQLFHGPERQRPN